MSGSDELARGETKCMTQCFHKYYRYMAYANTLYTYLTADEETDGSIKASLIDSDDPAAYEWEKDKLSPQAELLKASGGGLPHQF